MFGSRQQNKVRWRWTLCLVAGTAALAAGLWRGWPGRADGPVQLAFVTELGGITAPCGCTSRPLGGLDVLAALIEARRTQAPLAWFGVGATFFDHSPGRVALAGHRRATAGIIADVLSRLAPTACVLSAADALEARTAGAAPWLGSALTVATPQAALPWQSSLILGAHRIGLLGIAGAATSDDVAALSSAAAELRARGMDGVILLFAGELREARARLGSLTHVDAVIAGHDGPPAEPERLGDAMLLDAGARGEHVGVLTLSFVHRGQPRHWQWDDGGASQRRPLQRQYERFVREAEALPAGPGRQARQARAAALATQIAAIATPAVDSVRMTWALEPLDADRPRAAWAQRALTGYNDALCATAMADSGQRECPPSKDAASHYIGSAACQACHPAPWQVWQQSRHAQAWKTLTDAHKACDLSCVGCHVVGWEQPGGFCHLEDSPAYQNVGCENCHGPGAGHVAHPTERAQWGAQFVRDTPESTCRGCHNEQHSDQFNFATYRPRVLGPGHGAPLDDAALP